MATVVITAVRSRRPGVVPKTSFIVQEGILMSRKRVQHSTAKLTRLPELGAPRKR